MYACLEEQRQDTGMWTFSIRWFCPTVSAHTHPRLWPKVGFSFLEDERCDDLGKNVRLHTFLPTYLTDAAKIT
ncbi:rCG27842, isoform CRA_d [Rattus norvegicus]|uniref:RCG27842, isoform CRA_d n=1 Tax=Rattus norvegicus TaxID=10116 RepID=A6IEI6_RAT|nr:rCG27842, isoform CRA_d [Rattus norvegicus]